MKKPSITAGEWRLGIKPGPYIYGDKGTQVAACDMTTNFAVENLANSKAIAALPKLLEALEQAHNALLYIAQEAEARAGVPKPIIGGARHHAAQAKAALLAAGYTE